MIKINLRPNLNALEADANSEDQGVDAEIQRKGLTHIAMILVPAALLFVYASQAKPDKQRQMAAINAQIQELIEFNQKQSALVLEIQQIEKDEKEVEGRIAALNQVAIGRLAEIKLLDLLQTIIRDKMWLTLIEVSEAQVKIEGMSQSDIDVSFFHEELTKNVLFKTNSVNLDEQNQEVYEGQNYSKFKISAILEKSK